MNPGFIRSISSGIPGQQGGPASRKRSSADGASTGMEVPTVNTFNTKTPDPMLVCPPWCDLERHDQCEQLRGLRHSRDMLTLDAPRVTVDIVRQGYHAPERIHLGVGELVEGSAALTIEQATEVIQALQDAVDVVAEAAS